MEITVLQTTSRVQCVTETHRIEADVETSGGQVTAISNGIVFTTDGNQVAHFTTQGMGSLNISYFDDNRAEALAVIEEAIAAMKQKGGAA